MDTLTFGTVASIATRLLDISGGTVNIGALTTGQATRRRPGLTHIHGGTVTLENTVTFFTGSIFRLVDRSIWRSRRTPRTATPPSTCSPAAR